jgi:hypothetical protein
MLSLAGAVATPTLVAPHVAHARRTTDLGYRYDQVWTAAVRLVRVDYGFNVTERDQDLGFVMFDYIEAGRTFNGSIEVVRTSDALGRERVRVVVVIQGQPEYVERMVMDRLERKLRGDYGAPPRPEPTPAPAATTAPAAEGADASDGDSDAGEAGR